MDDEIWKLKCDSKQSTKFSRLVEDMTLTWKDSYICDMTMAYHNFLLLPNIHVHVEYKCNGNIQGLNFAKSGRAVLPDRYKTYHHCSSELLKLLVDSHISFKAIRLASFLREFVGSEISVECVPLLEKLLYSVIALDIIVHDVAVAEKLLSIIFTNPCQVKYLTVYRWKDLELVSPFITDNPHCKLKNIKLGNHMSSLRRSWQSLDMLYCFLDSQDELEKLQISCRHLENFNYSIFSPRPTFKELTISVTKNGYISMDIMQQFFMSPYPVTLKLYKVIISDPHCLQIQSHPTQHSKTLELSCCHVSEECLPSTVHLKNLVLSANFVKGNCVKCFSKLDNITVDECISVSTDNMDDLNELSHITTTKEWNIDVTLSEDTQDKFIVALTNIKGVVTKLNITMNPCHMSSIAEAIFTSLQSSLSQLELHVDLSVCGYQSSHVREFYEIWKQCGSIQLKKLTLRGYHDDDGIVRDIVALISNDFMIDCYIIT